MYCEAFGLHDQFIHAKFVVKRYIEDDKTIIVLRSILNDELYPHEEGFHRDEKTIW